MRMNNVLVLVLCGLLCISLGAAWCFAGEEAEGELCIPLGTIEIEAPEGAEVKRTPVEFPHTLHFEFNCKECHHNWTGEEQNLGCMTSGCHDLAKKPEKAGKAGKADKDKSVQYFKDAFHKSCLGCHKAMKSKQKKVELSRTLDASAVKYGPTGCVECHPKE